MSAGPNRRLAAIVSADVVGYSRLMGVDEAGTLAAMKAHRRELWIPTIERFGGRVVGGAGDSILVEYSSAVAAVEYSIAVQRAMAERNADLPDDRRMLLRIGINIGEVIVDGDDIYGDGVNVAARMQEIAEPGGIAISDIVRGQVHDKLEATFADDGPQEVKNIARPVHVWRWPAEGQSSPGPAANAGAKPLPMPDKPSIAVLPFNNISGDPEQEYFADGITEDIITALSKFRWFFVTARNSTFTYKGSAIDIKQVGRDLGVQYVLEGSVRRGGSRIRITAQLIEAESGNHIWAERYDRELDDIFELQDEITLTIAAAVEPELAGSERDRALYKLTEDLQAWDLFHRGLAKIWQMDKESMAEGAEFMNRALAMDPKMGQAYAYLAVADFLDVTMSRGESREVTLRQGVSNANKALSIDPRDYVARWALGRLHNLNGDNQSAIRELENCVRINPNFAHGYYGIASVHALAGQPEKAIEFADMAIRLNPNDPVMWMVLAYKAFAFAMLGNIDEAIKLLEQSCQFPSVQFIPFTMLASLYARVGRTDDAAAALEGARRLEPDLSLKHMEEYLENADKKLRDIFFKGFRKAGLA